MLSPRAQSWNRRTLLPSEERFLNDLKTLERFHTSLFSAPEDVTLEGLLHEQVKKLQSQANPELLEKAYVSARLFANTMLQREHLRSCDSLLEILPTLQMTWFWRIYLGVDRLLIPKRMLPKTLSWFILSSDSALLFTKQKPLLESWLQGFFSPYFSKKDPLLFRVENSTWSWELN